MQLKECEKLLEEATEQINVILREREYLVYATVAELRQYILGICP